MFGRNLKNERQSLNDGRIKIESIKGKPI